MGKRPGSMLPATVTVLYKNARRLCSILLVILDMGGNWNLSSKLLITTQFKMGDRPARQGQAASCKLKGGGDLL